jgi:hypothetical protein
MLVRNALLALMAIAVLSGFSTRPAWPQDDPPTSPIDPPSETEDVEFAPDSVPYWLNFRAEGDRAYVNGLMSAVAPNTFREFIAENPQIKWLVLEIMPGTEDAYATLELGRLIRKQGLNTYVPSDAKIESGATDVFISGVKRVSECGALIGVHAWRYPYEYSARDLPRDPTLEDHRPTLQFYDQMGILPKFYWFTINAASPEELHFMTPAELEHYGLVTEPMNCESP